MMAVLLKRFTYLPCVIWSLAPHTALVRNCIKTLRVHSTAFFCTSAETGEKNTQSRKKKFEPHRMTADELNSYGNTLLQKLTAVKETETHMEKYQNSKDLVVHKAPPKLLKQLSSILHFLVEQNAGKSELMERIGEPESLNIVGSENVSTVIMRYYAEQNDIANVRRILTHLKDQEALHVRSFAPLIAHLMRCGKFDEGMAVLKGLLLYAKDGFSSAVFCEVINVFTDIRTLENEEILMKNLVAVFDMLNGFIAWHAHDTQRNAEVNRENLAKAITGWFNGWKGFSVESTVIDPQTGRCQNCKTSLKVEYKITPDGLKGLKRRMSAIVKDHVTTRQGSYNEFAKLGVYLEEQGRFDVVVDGLNVVYLWNTFHPWRLKAVAEYFIKLNKRVLVIGYGKLQNRFLKKRYPDIAAYLHSNCGMYLARTSDTDDQCLYYTLCHHNFQMELVSNDLFRDAQNFLDVESKSNFLAWQQRKQYIIKSFHGDVPQFYPRKEYEVSVQNHSHGWHVPIDSDSWLCIVK